MAKLWRAGIGCPDRNPEWLINGFGVGCGHEAHFYFATFGRYFRDLSRNALRKAFYGRNEGIGMAVLARDFEFQIIGLPRLDAKRMFRDSHFETRPRRSD